MRAPKTAYELSQSQVATPAPVVSLFWKLVHERRPHLSQVLDLGAGDGRFACGGSYERYTGIEIDPSPISRSKLPPNAELIKGCAFRHKSSDYDACIGNPPYVRHHDIESPWKEWAAQTIEKQLNLKLNLHGNLYLYFICLGLIKTKTTGLVGTLVPFEWLSRPSAASLRTLIEEKGWNLSAYRFTNSIFNGVLTTASICIIDKAQLDGKWAFYNIDSKLRIKATPGVTGNRFKVLRHAKRSVIWAKRGMSPGSQKIFTLTEGERIHAGLTKADVMPCVTSLRELPKDIQKLTPKVFKRYFIDQGRRCWLIRSTAPKLSSRLKAYLDGIPKEARDTWTCHNQTPWYAYEDSQIPHLLFHSAFTSFSPKVAVNGIKAHAVGSVYGIHAPRKTPLHKLRNFLTSFNFEKRIVTHAKSLKKVEVRQVNDVLSKWN